MYLRSVGGLIGILLMLVCLCAASAIEVKNLEANSGLAYEVTENLEVGDKEYTDREYTFTSIPDYLVGLTWIRTANNDKQNPDLEVSFETDREAYVYILWVARDPAAQDWLQDNYTLLEGDEVGSTDEPLAVYKSNTPFAAGEVKLPAHRAGLLGDPDQNSSSCWADFSCSWW